MSRPMPAIFFGHGNPMNALESNVFTEAWAALGAGIPHPRAILAISAHWSVPRTAVTASRKPRTIHDFGGFPPELHRVSYPAPGDPALARRIQEILAPVPVEEDEKWGLDHGTWSVLCHLFPKANVPVVQLSLDERQPAGFHHDLGRRLAPLRDENILILGSGNLVHNLHAYAWDKRGAEPLDWAVRFETKARELILSGDHGRLIRYDTLGRDAQLSVPTPEHYLPLLYVLGTQWAGEPVSFPVEGIEGGSISMLAVRIG